MKRNELLATLTAATAAATLFLAAPAAAQSRDTLLHEGMCAIVEVPGILVLPDGTSHDAPQARICFERWLSPVAAIHVLYVDGAPWGMLLSHASRNEETRRDNPVVVFERNGSAQLRLLGYAWPDRHSMLSMVFGQPGRNVDAARLFDDRERRDDLILVAARIE